MYKKIFISALIVTILTIGTFIFITKQKPIEIIPPTVLPETTTTNTNTAPSDETVITALANPASTFCTENGGSLEMVHTPAGDYGNCSFPNGQTCEEWKLFQGECDIDGVSTSASYTSGTTTIQATFRIKADTVEIDAPELDLSDTLLSQATSASGIRYLSSDTTIEFWEHQGIGTLTKNGIVIFSGKNSR